MRFFLTIKQLLENEQFKDDKILFSKLKELVQQEENIVAERLKTEHISQSFNSFFENFKGKKQPILTKFENFNKSFCGFQQGEFVVIGARPGMGKTALTTEFILQIAQQNPTLLFSAELSKSEFINRMLGRLIEIDPSQISEKNLSQEKIKELFLAAEEIQKLSLYINDSYKLTTEDFRKECVKYIQEKDIKVIFIDYLQLMAHSQKWNTRELEVATICQELKNIAHEFNVCIIATSQLSRSVETQIGHKRPRLSDFRESGAIEIYADKVFLLYRPEYYKIFKWEDGSSAYNQAELILAKSTNRKLNSIRLGFKKGIFYDNVNYQTKK